MSKYSHGFTSQIISSSTLKLYIHQNSCQSLTALFSVSPSFLYFLSLPTLTYDRSILSTSLLFCMQVIYRVYTPYIVIGNYFLLLSILILLTFKVPCLYHKAKLSSPSFITTLFFFFFILQVFHVC